MISEKHSFDSCFEVFFADTPESKRIHYNLRYQVYCDELGYEDKENFPEQMEFDEWDPHAVHFIVRQRYSGQWLGALRLVYQNQASFPFEAKCVPEHRISARQYQQSIEISRLCVLREARRFAPRAFQPCDMGAEQIVKGNGNGNVRYLHTIKNQSRSIMWGLYRAAVIYSARNDIKRWYILVTPSLAHAVKKEGFEMHQVGKACDYRGQRIPYVLDVEHILANSLWQKDYRADYRKYSDLLAQSAAKRYMA
ncbi:PEP-CTERM/exosortase system-associated acyltransferase [Methylomonas albis]|uniref:PEP-CTERM/exosortase system-associated acyltransferase n=1 Tax=Methylomonas albis TaxID=1854563 RepID=A0ABR9CW95_9GAMM|nr:PEP-CTERM/exosortase system-associated acyltransferase [Methylomonas albis]MBD9355127.1 PEP-CTERM/exosortase system-associated acyltransferase [Methylomonas albis]